ncbi:MAG: hypothetical protein V3V88_00455 [Dehalococcoidia bacterium]
MTEKFKLPWKTMFSSCDSYCFGCCHYGFYTGCYDWGGNTCCGVIASSPLS